MFRECLTCNAVFYIHLAFRSFMFEKLKPKEFFLCMKKKNCLFYCYFLSMKRKQ